ncbi:MAG: VWA domain-containing protein [Verrucomicrobiae bacterium]|nr:VWA domain-containing protein [Verrucomicrobiae bacterium]
MAQLDSHLVSKPFGEVNVFPQSDGKCRVVATILMPPADVEQAQTGLAIDASKSMATAFGIGSAPPPFPQPENIVEPVGNAIAEYLANFDSDGETSIIYWACGKFGDDIEVLGDFQASAAADFEFVAPKNMGTGTKLLPAIKYFTETRFRAQPWGIFLFITDGIIEDLDEVKEYTREISLQIASGQRGFVKLVIIGLGSEFFYKNSKTNETLSVDAAEGRLVELESDTNWFKSPAWSALEELDDLDDDPTYGKICKEGGEPVDIWDHKLASNMKSLEEIFAEPVQRSAIISPTAEVIDSYGNPVESIDGCGFSNGLPARFEFLMPSSSTSFVLKLPGGVEFVQSLK